MLITRTSKRSLLFAISITTIGFAHLQAQGPARPAEVVEPSASVSAVEQREAELDEMTAQIGATLRCPVCRQQSVAESSARISREMQGIIRTMLVEGKTPEEIEAYFVESYGPWILLRPKAEGANLFVYFGPLGVFLLGGLLLFGRLRRTRRELTASESMAEPGQGAADHVNQTDRDWLESALKG